MRRLFRFFYKNLAEVFLFFCALNTSGLCRTTFYAIRLRFAQARIYKSFVPFVSTSVNIDGEAKFISGPSQTAFDAVFFTSGQGSIYKFQSPFVIAHHKDSFLQRFCCGLYYMNKNLSSVAGITDVKVKFHEYLNL